MSKPKGCAAVFVTLILLAPSALAGAVGTRKLVEDAATIFGEDAEADWDDGKNCLKTFGKNLVVTAEPYTRRRIEYLLDSLRRKPEDIGDM